MTTCPIAVANTQVRRNGLLQHLVAWPYVLVGLTHFTHTDLFMQIMPPYIPLHHFCVLASGVAEVALGLGVLYGPTRRLAAWGLLALLAAVYPANIHMALNNVQIAGLPAIPTWAAWARLPLQFVMAWLVWLAFLKKPNRPFNALQEWLGHLVINPMTRLNITIYKATNGRMMGRLPGGAPILLLHTIGRKSGLERTAALLYLRQGDSLYVVGSLGGMSAHPLWVHNLDAQPQCAVTIGGERSNKSARLLDDQEKATIWPALVAMYPDYDTYQARTTRNIRVYELTPR